MVPLPPHHRDVDSLSVLTPWHSLHKYCLFTSLSWPPKYNGVIWSTSPCAVTLLQTWHVYSSRSITLSLILCSSRPTIRLTIGDDRFVFSVVTRFSMLVNRVIGSFSPYARLTPSTATNSKAGDSGSPSFSLIAM